MGLQGAAANIKITHQNSFKALSTSNIFQEVGCIIRKTVANKLSQIVYEGTWFTPLREALIAFSDKLNEVTERVNKILLENGELKDFEVE